VVAIRRWAQRCERLNGAERSGRAVNGRPQPQFQFIGTAGRARGIRSPSRFKLSLPIRQEALKAEDHRIGIESGCRRGNRTPGAGAPGGQPVGAHAGAGPWPDRRLQAAISSDGGRADRPRGLRQLHRPKN